jgi:hypothetical protein
MGPPQRSHDPNQSGHYIRDGRSRSEASVARGNAYVACFVMIVPGASGKVRDQQPDRNRRGEQQQQQELAIVQGLPQK